MDAIVRARQWAPGTDVVHTEHGPGWVWGSGVGRVTVRFETADTGPGPVRTFRVDDPELEVRPRGRYDVDESSADAEAPPTPTKCV